MNASRRDVAAAVAAALLAVALQVVALRVQSLSGDGAYHLLAGHQALRYGQNTVNFEHPPLVKLVVSLPLVFADEPLAPPVEVDQALAAANGVYARGGLVKWATVAGRTVALVVFVLPLFFACYAFGRRLGDPATGVVLALMMALSLSSLPYLTILQTDAAVTLAFLLTLLAALAYAAEGGLGRAVLVGLAAGFGLAVKFSALLLGPAVLAAFVLAPGSRRRRLLELLAAAVVVVLVVEAVYLAANRAYDPELGRRTISTYCANKGTLAVDGEMAPWEPRLLAVERVDPRLAQWLTGFLGVRVQNAIGVYPSYAFGEVRSAGRWWYFPVVFLVKTPLVVLAAALAALWAVRWRGLGRRPWHERRWIVPALVVGVYLGTSLTSNYNLSVRHLLPVLPLLYLPIARFLAAVRWRAWVVVLALAAEALWLTPLWMSSTNTWWLGEANPSRFVLGAGNLEYRQNFNVLAREAAARRLEPLTVLYPALPAEVVHAYLPAARVGRPGRDVEPGWYAVNVTVEQFVPALLEASPEGVYNYAELERGARAWEPYWHQVTRRGEDHGWIAGTFHLYRVGE